MGKKKVKVRSIQEKAITRKVVEPLLINFEHASVKAGADLEEFNCSIYQSDPRVTRRPRKVVAIKSEAGLTYLGSNDSPLGGSNEMRTFIAIRRKSDRKSLQLYETSELTVSPFIHGHSYIEEKERDTDIKLTLEEKRKSTQDLIMAFGSKAKILSHERMAKMAVDPNEMDTSLGFAADSAPVEELKMSNNTDTTISTLLPPCNRAAHAPQGVYTLSDILAPEEMDNLQELAEQLLALAPSDIETMKATKKFSEYFFTMWSKLSLRKTTPEAIYLTKLVIYTELLICIKKLGATGVKKPKPSIPEEFPDWLIQKALGTFTFTNAHNTRTYSIQLQDKTICYILVLILLANDFYLDVNLATISLQVHIKKLLTLAKMVGVTTKYDAGTKDYNGRLKIPLPKQVENRGGRRGR